MAVPESANEPAVLERLMVRYQQGDRGAAAALALEVSPMLLRFCLSQGERPQDAEDRVQEIWLRIHQSRHTYRPGEPAAPWIYAIARYTCVDAYRRNRKRQSHEMQVETLADLPAPVPASATQFTDMLEQLPVSEREVITMLKGFGMSLEEVARATATTVGAVKQKSHRAYKRLRQLLAASPSEDVRP